MTQPVGPGMAAGVAAHAAMAPVVMVAARIAVMRVAAARIVTVPFLAVSLVAVPAVAAPAVDAPAAPGTAIAPATTAVAGTTDAPGSAVAEPPAGTAALTVRMQKATQSGPGDVLGTVTITRSDAGARFTLKLHTLPPGPHGFHVHEDAECGPIFINGVRIPAGAAGRHWDPDHTNKHASPTGDGHLGDLPLIDVGTDGTATQTLTAPRIKDMQSLQGHALVIDAGGDTYSDTPSPQGGGGLRIACGSIE